MNGSCLSVCYSAPFRLDCASNQEDRHTFAHSSERAREREREISGSCYALFPVIQKLERKVREKEGGRLEGRRARAVG